MDIRTYTNEDFTGVRRVLNATDLFVPAVDTRKRFQDKIERHPDSIIVAERDDAVVGTVFVTDDATTVLITRLAVLPDHQGQGIGRSLLDAAESWLVERGTRIAVAFAETSDPELLDWYRERGYTNKGQYEMMWKDL